MPCIKRNNAVMSFESPSDMITSHITAVTACCHTESIDSYSIKPIDIVRINSDRIAAFVGINLLSTTHLSSCEFELVIIFPCRVRHNFAIIELDRIIKHIKCVCRCENWLPYQRRPWLGRMRPTLKSPNRSDAFYRSTSCEANWLFACLWSAILHCRCCN